MRRLAAFVIAFSVVLLGLLVHLRPAHACENSVLAEKEDHRLASEAKAALDESDVARARELATEAQKITSDTRVARDAEHTIAISWIRDPGASREDIDRATETLRRHVVTQQVTDPRYEADLGEAYARHGDDEAAYQTLSSLANRDLIGSAYAYAALARVAAKRGDKGTAANATQRCSEITTNASICRGEYPSPPLLRGKALGYALPGVLAVIALVRRRRNPKQTPRPWSSYGDKVFAAIVVATGAFVFAYARTPWLTTVVTFFVLALVGFAQRLAFVAAVKRDRIPGWVLRTPSAEDTHLPEHVSFFTSGQQVLERVPDASYREPARVGVLRLRARGPLARGLVIAAGIVLALLVAASTMTMRATRSASVPVESRLDL